MIGIQGRTTGASLSDRDFLLRTVRNSRRTAGRQILVGLVGGWPEVHDSDLPLNLDSGVVTAVRPSGPNLDLNSKALFDWLLVGPSYADRLHTLIGNAARSLPGARIAVAIGPDAIDGSNLWIPGCEVYLADGTPIGDVLMVLRFAVEFKLVVADEAVLNRYLVRKALVRDTFLGKLTLTARELEVLKLIQSGSRNDEIARRLQLKTGTIEFHVTNILSKLGARNRTEAVSRARDAGLL